MAKGKKSILDKCLHCDEKVSCDLYNTLRMIERTESAKVKLMVKECSDKDMIDEVNRR